MNNWSEFTREDLKIISIAESLGWTPEFSQADVMFDRMTPKRFPMECVSFIKGNIHTWKCKKYWQVADLIKGNFCNHRPEESIENVFKKY